LLRKPAVTALCLAVLLPVRAEAPLLPPLSPEAGARGRREGREPFYGDRWVYVMTNLQVEKQADDLVRLIGRAARAGYNSVVLADYKLNILDRVPGHYFKHLERVKKAAQDARVEVQLRVSTGPIRPSSCGPGASLCRRRLPLGRGH
jgi:hypothetical protein